MKRRMKLSSKGQPWPIAKHNWNGTRCWYRCIAFICMFYNSFTVGDKALSDFLNDRKVSNEYGKIARLDPKNLSHMRKYRMYRDESHYILTHPKWTLDRKLPQYFGTRSKQFNAEIPMGDKGRKGIKTIPTEQMYKWAEAILKNLFEYDGTDWSKRDYWVTPSRDMSVVFEKTFEPDPYQPPSTSNRESPKTKRKSSTQKPNGTVSPGGKATPSFSPPSSFMSIKDALGNTPEEAAKVISRKGSHWYAQQLSKAKNNPQ